MRTYSYALAFVAMSALYFCTPKEDPKTEEPPVEEQPVLIEEKQPQPNTTVIIEKEVPAPPPKDPDGTEINVSGDGVSVKSKNGERETNVGINRDSSRVIIRRPK